MTTLTILNHEWHTARDIIAATDPSETDRAHGVAMVTAGGARHWTAWTDEVTITTTPVSAEGTAAGVVLVSRRLVEFAASMVDAGDEMTLILDADSATVRGTMGSLTLDHPCYREQPPVQLMTGPAVTAKLTVDTLGRFMWAGSTLPKGVKLDTLTSPLFELSVTPTGLEARVDWRAAGVPASRLEVVADTRGTATSAIRPNLTANVISWADANSSVTVVFPAHRGAVIFETTEWTASIRTEDTTPAETGSNHLADSTHSSIHPQLELFDGGEFAGGSRVDAFAGWALTDVRAFAIDPDPEVRLAAAASRWNLDVRLQQILGTDPDERVALALLDNVDPCLDTCQQIIAGPHTTARRVLASRNLCTELLELLAADSDPITSAAAARTRADRVRFRSEIQVVS